MNSTEGKKKMQVTNENQNGSQNINKYQIKEKLRSLKHIRNKNKAIEKLRYLTK